LKTDVMTVTVLPDGSIKVEVAGSITGPNHANAENLVRAMAQAIGGETTVTRGSNMHSHHNGGVHHEH